jgi:hypothetical protein
MKWRTISGKKVNESQRRGEAIRPFTAPQDYPLRKSLPLPYGYKSAPVFTEIQ